MSKDKGYILLYRSIKDNWIWEDKPFNKASAWIDLLMSANHNGNKVLMGSELIDVERGSFITSQDKLQHRWGWGNTKLRSFLKLLEKDKMIELKSTTKQTSINIVNYNVYQISQTDNKPLPNHKQTTCKPLPNTNNTLNELKELKEKKKIYLDNIFLTDEQYQKLITHFGSEDITKEKIETLSNGIKIHGYKYKDHYLTILAWDKRDKEKNPQPFKDNVWTEEMKKRYIEDEPG